MPDGACLSAIMTHSAIAVKVAKTNKQTNCVAFSLKANHNEWSPLVGKVTANFCGYRGVVWSVQRVPMAINHGFIDWSCYFFIQVAL
jgi:hypothetical protein